jgi:hypothetical protein
LTDNETSMMTGPDLAIDLSWWCEAVMSTHRIIVFSAALLLVAATPAAAPPVAAAAPVGPGIGSVAQGIQSDARPRWVAP